jgi:hypothetical protein
MDLGIGKNLRADCLAFQVYQFLWIDHRIRSAPQFFRAITRAALGPPGGPVRESKDPHLMLTFELLSTPARAAQNRSTTTNTAGPGTKT